MKKRFLKIGAVALSLAMMAAVGAACSGGNESDTAVSYVALEVNPEISIALDKKNVVVSVTADNEDAQVLLYEEELIGKKIDEALDKIAELCVEMQFLNKNNSGVDVIVEGKVDDEEIVGKAQTAFETHAGDLGVNVSSEGTFSLQRKLNAVKAEYASDAAVQGMSLAKFRLVLEAQEADGTLTVTAAAEMDVSELINLVAEAAKKIEPYATQAYNTAVAAAQRVYADAKDSMLEKIWLVPYVNVLEYNVNYALIYNLYRDCARTLSAGIDAAEIAAEAAQNAAVPASVTDAIAEAMGMTEDEKAEFLAEVTVDGKVTLAALDAYFDRYFKNMTQEERAEAEALMEEIMGKVQEFAKTVDESIAQEYKDALGKLCEDLTSLIPVPIQNIANTYVTEFKVLIADLTAATDGKEPLPAAKASLEAIEARAEAVMQTMREDLSEEDLAAVEEAIQKISDQMTAAENKFAEAKSAAEQQAKEYLSALKQSRLQKTAA